MKWPWVSRKVHELELARLEEKLAAERRITEQQVELLAYWRKRAERLTDAALQRAGAIHEPTMVDKVVPPSAVATVAAAWAMREIDSSEQSDAGR